MERKYKQRFLKLYNWMKQPQRKLAHKKFCFNYFNDPFGPRSFLTRNECAALGCMAGELPAIFPSTWEWDEFWIHLKGGNDLIANNFAIFFGINMLEVYHLFYPHRQMKEIDPYRNNKEWLYPDATKREVVKNLERFLKIKGVL